MEIANKTEMILYIIRGLPGTGKTTLAHKISNWVCEADQYFTDDKDNYNFDRTQLKDAHDACRIKVSNGMLNQISPIAVSNTSSQRWEFKPYLDLAQIHGYKVIEITMTGESFGSIHNVPNEKIQIMKDRWEK